MLIFDQLKKSDRELQCVAVAVLAGLGILVAGLWYVQVVRADRYRANLQDQAVRTVRVPAIRGKILDRNRTPLAENRPSYNVNLYLEELRRNFTYEYTNGVRKEFRQANPHLALTRAIREELERQARYRVASNILYHVSSAVNEPRILLPADFHNHYDRRRSLPLPLLKDLSKPQVAMFVEKAASLPSLAMETQALRNYPEKTAAAHLLGHLRREDNPVEDEDIAFRFRLPDYIGVKGLEAAFDSELRGKAGVKLVLVNSMQYRQAEDILQPSEPGKNVVLTIDRSIQLAAEQALSKLGTNRPAAAVVIDVQTGDLYALASSPTFDPNKFITGFTPEEWEAANMNDPHLRPMVNRATYGRYPPGSSFKIIVALAGLEAGTLDPDEIYQSEGFFRLTSRGRPIDDTAPKGPYDFQRAFYRSSNSYFITNGLRAGAERIIAMARQFRLGDRTGLWPRLEDPGALPAPGEPRKLDGSPWMRGDTANLSIGHGEILVTPLQMAVVTAAVANGGKVLQPRLVMQIEPQDSAADTNIVRFPDRQVRDEIKVKPKHLELVRKAMLADVENRDEGTGRFAFLPGYRIAGKTGTAKLRQGFSIVWFVSFAPFENPRYAIAVVVEGGGGGGVTCGPIARDIYKALMQREPAPYYRQPSLAREEGRRARALETVGPDRGFARLQP